MSEVVSINGVIHDAASATIPVMDHGFLFGDSVYETMRAYEGRFFRWDDHFRRLGASAAALELRVPASSAALLAWCEAAMDAAGVGNAAIRIVVTRGVGPMDIDPSSCDSPTVLCFARPRPRYPEHAYRDGLTLAIVSRERNPKRSLDPAVKSGNYLNSVLALAEARKTGAYEAVMLNAAGLVTEGSTSNVFAVRKGVVRTPPLSAGILGGITRKTVLALCAEVGVDSDESPLSPEELLSADEVFLSSTLKQVLPISSIDGRTVGEGKAGPVTLRLLKAYRAAVRAETDVEPDEDS